MDNDFVQVKKLSFEDRYAIEIYFSSVESYVTVSLTEVDFVRFMHESIKLVNSNSNKFLLRVPDDISSLLTRYDNEQLKTFYRNTIDKKESVSRPKSKPTAEVLIYIPDYHVPLLAAEKIVNGSAEFMESLGFELETEDKPIFSSFFKKLKFVFSKTIADEDLEKIYSKGKKALELKHLELPTAEQTEMLANAAEKMVNSLNNVDEGVIRCGALLVLKKQVNGKPKLIIQQLTSELIILLDKKPHLLKNLSSMYEILKTDEYIDDTKDDLSSEAMIA